jgi:hypothetical protein
VTTFVASIVTTFALSINRDREDTRERQLIVFDFSCEATEEISNRTLIVSPQLLDDFKRELQSMQQST